MSNVMRYKWGDTKPAVSAPVASAVAIEIGDLIYAASGLPRPASALAWDTSLAVTQEAFHDAFLGVAGQQSRVGDDDAIRYATSGVFEFDCASASFAVGDLVGPAKQSGNALESQKVVAVATPNLAIGRVAEVATNATKVLVEIMGVLTPGRGPVAAA